MNSSCFLILYADDAVVFAKSPVVLQSILYDIESYCTLWGLMNTAKTKDMISEKGRHTHFDIYLNNVKLEVVTSFKYLGIPFFKNGNWHRTHTHKKNYHNMLLLLNINYYYFFFFCRKSEMCTCWMPRICTIHAPTKFIHPYRLIKEH